MPTADKLAHAILSTFPAPPGAVVLGETPATVAQWLTQATAAHLDYRRAQVDRTDPEPALREAAIARAHAERLDPDHTDPAWGLNGSGHLAGLATHVALHEDLLQFYTAQLHIKV
jgi:hypothetical protein